MTLSPRCREPQPRAAREHSVAVAGAALVAFSDVASTSQYLDDDSRVRGMVLEFIAVFASALKYVLLRKQTVRKGKAAGGNGSNRGTGLDDDEEEGSDDGGGGAGPARGAGRGRGRGSGGLACADRGRDTSPPTQETAPSGSCGVSFRPAKAEIKSAELLAPKARAPARVRSPLSLQIGAVFADFMGATPH